MLAGSKLFQKTEKTKKIGTKTEKKLKENGKTQIIYHTAPPQREPRK